MNKITLLLSALLFTAVAAFGLSADTLAKKNNTELLIGVWNVDNIDLNDSLVRTPQQKEVIEKALKEILKGSYFIFSKDGTYEMSIQNETAEGTWWFGQDGKTLYTKENGDQEVPITIKELTESRCVMIYNEEDEAAIFILSKAANGFNDLQKEAHEKYLAQKKQEQAKTKK